MFEDIPVREVMLVDVATAEIDRTAEEAAVTIREEDVGSVVVLREGTPVGILTEADFARQLCDRPDLAGVELEEVMSAPLVTVGPDVSIHEAAATVREHDIKHLPVVDDGELRGIVTTAELCRYIPQLMHPPAARPELPPRRSIRPDTAYEREEWSFEYRGVDETKVSVGDVATFERSLSTEDVEAFADATGDTNRLHLEEAYAAGTRFGGRIAHGALAVGLISAALARLPGLTIYLSQEAAFRGPLAVGDRASARCEIVDDLGGSKFRVETTVSDGDDEPVLEGEAVVLVDELPPGTEKREGATAD